jgi:hypothetical protein
MKEIISVSLYFRHSIANTHDTAHKPVNTTYENVHMCTRVCPNVSGLTYKSRAKWKMLRGIYSAIYVEVYVSVSICVEIKGDYTEKWQSCFISITLKSWSGRKLLDPPSYI